MKEQQTRKIQQFHPEIEDGTDLRRLPHMRKSWHRRKLASTCADAHSTYMYLSYLCCWEKPRLVDTRQPRQDRDQTWSWRKNKSKYRNSVWVIDVLLSMQTLWWLKHSNILLFRGNLRFHFLIAQVWCQFKKLLPQFLSKSKQMIWDPHLRYFSFLGNLKDCKSIKCLTKFFTDLPAGRMDLRWAGRRGRSRLQSTSCGCSGSPWSSQRGSPWKSQFFIWNWCPGVLI